MRDIFFKFDLFLFQKTKREQVLIFLFPIIIFAGFIFGIIMPKVDMFYLVQDGFLKEQIKISSTLNQANIDAKLDELSSELQVKQKLFSQLKERAISNKDLSTSLELFSKNIGINDSKLSLYTIGDVELFEDVLEQIENNYFVFIEMINLSAYFTNDLEIKIDMLNFGDKLKNE